MSRGIPLFLLVSNAANVSVLHCHLKLSISVIPLLLDDTRRVMESWGVSGNFDPFDNVYEVSVLVTSHRLLLPY